MEEVQSRKIHYQPWGSAFMFTHMQVYPHIYVYLHTYKQKCTHTHTPFTRKNGNAEGLKITRIFIKR